MTLGITVNIGAADDEAIACKSSDIAHGITDQAETDTFGTISKAVSATGGVELRGLSEDEIGVMIRGGYTNDDTAKTTAANGAVITDARKKSGTAWGAAGADANVFVIQENGAARFLVDEDGDYWYDGADGGAFDEFDDALMVRAVALASSGRGVIRDKWDAFVKYNEDDLIDARILGAPVADGGLVNGAQLQRLHTGAIWQNRTKIEAQAARIQTLEQRLLEA